MTQLSGRTASIARIRDDLSRAPPGVLLNTIESLALPVRAYNALKHAGLARIGDLAQISEGEVRRFRGLGIVSLKDIHAALMHAIEEHIFANCGELGAQESGSLLATDQCQSARSDSATDLCDEESEEGGDGAKKFLIESEADKTFAQMFERVLKSMGERSAQVLRERAGVCGESKTLEAVARPLGLTRERVRQIQTKALNRTLRQSRLGTLLEAKLLKLLDGRNTPLYLAGLPAEDPWFEGTPSPELLLGFLIDNLGTSRLGTITLHGRRVVSNGSQGDWDRKADSANTFVKNSCGKDLTEPVVRAAVEAICGNQFHELSEDMYGAATKHAIFVSKPQGRVLVAYGRGANQKVLAILESAEAPLHYSDIAERVAEVFGPVELRRVHAAVDDVGCLLGRGVYGLRRHIGVNEAEATFLASIAAEIVRDGPVGRQWHASELLSELREMEAVSEELNHFGLSALLRQYSSLRYMGRQVWAQGDHGGDQSQKRLDLHNAVEATLREAGSPMSAFDIFKRVTAIRGVGAFFQIHPKGIVFRVGPSTWGLVTRDLSITHAELQRHLHLLEAILRESKSAIHVSELSQKLNLGVRADNCGWQVFGAAQLDTRFKSFSSDYLGLSDWNATGRLAVHDAVELGLRGLGDEAPLEHIQERIEQSLGRRISADTVKCALRDRGAIYDRQRAVWVFGLAEELDEESSSLAES